MTIGHRLSFALAGAVAGMVLPILFGVLGLMAVEFINPALVESLLPSDNPQALTEASEWFLVAVCCGTVAGAIVGGTTLASAVWKEEHP